MLHRTYSADSPDQGSRGQDFPLYAASMITFIGAIVLTAAFGARLIYDTKVLVGAMLILVDCMLAVVGWRFFPAQAELYRQLRERREPLTSALWSVAEQHAKVFYRLMAGYMLIVTTLNIGRLSALLTQK